MKNRKTKADKALDARITRVYNLYFDRVPVNMLDIPKIYKDIRDLITVTPVDGDGTFNQAFDTAVKDLVTTYRRV